MNNVKVYKYSFSKIIDNFGFLFVFPIILVLALYKVGLENFDAMEIVIFLPLLSLILIPLGAILILSRTTFIINDQKIVRKNIFGERSIKWNDVKSISERHLYAISPDLEKRCDMEIVSRNKTVIRVYRVLEEAEEAENEIRKYSRLHF